eukprot:TRINITY_DN28943_c0_g1_i1.p1 TRINITY_DN28943_c0_g1~~TRINITY_DN28943_c0_g1_i1.p1  ORF type:complete len:171 (+),score=34.95 TRINITY_DN28943_c0_g1_i1:3-515(+)
MYARPGLYTLRVLMSVSLQHLHEESSGYHDIRVGSEPRLYDKASVPKADRCLCPAAVSYMSSTGAAWDGSVDPLKGVYCADMCHYTDWKVKYFCSATVTVMFDRYTIVSGYELAAATGGVLGEVEFNEVVEIKAPVHHGVLSVAPKHPSYTVAVNGVSLVPLVSTSYFSP